MSEHECPKDGCGYTGDSEQAVKIHYGCAHEGSIADEYEKTCPECEETFSVGSQSQRQTHCSEDCYHAARSEQVAIDCEVCDTTVEVDPNEADTRRFCSRDCRKAALNEQLECDYCGETFEVYQHEADDRRYCSDDCSLADHRAKITCEQCGDSVQVPKSQADRRRFCSRECHHDFRRVEYEEQQCRECEEVFVGPEEQQWCSRECYYESVRNRVSLVCAECGVEYERPPYKAERSTYCSQACKTKGQRSYERSRCTHCDTVFSKPTYREQEYCSQDCFRDATAADTQVARRRCEGCRRKFQPPRNRTTQQFCSSVCWYEFARKPKNRPDTVPALLRELYVDRDHNHTETWRRVAVALEHGDFDEEYLTQADVRDRLQELGVWTYHSRHYESALDADPGETDDDPVEGDDSWREYYQPKEVAGDD